jgi:hypothetical protein
VHKRPLLNPDEIGRLLARIDDQRRPGYPGLVLALVPGEYPLLARRVNYFDSPWFLGYFDPHPNHPPPPTLEALSRAATQTRSLPLNHRRMLTARRVGIAFGAALSAGAVVHLSGMAPWSTSAVKSKPKLDFGPPDEKRSAVQRERTSDANVSFNFGPPQKRPAEQNPTPTNDPPDVNPAYAQGAADWRSLQAWFATQTGDRRAGADYWAANRSRRDGKSCADAAGKYGNGPQATSLFAAGCLEAKRWLDAIDKLRADPQYRTGFNDEAKRLPQQADAARYAIVTTPDDLKLRTGPAVSYSIVKVLLPGARVKILKDTDNSWKELEFQDTDGQVLHGFASGKYLNPAQ